MTTDEIADFRSLLLREQENENVGITVFLQSHFPDNAVVTFVEGDADRFFYFDFIKEYFPDRPLSFIACRSKHGVVSTKRYINERIKVGNRRILYFVDKDFSDYIDPYDYNGLFVTEGYSIESYLCQPAFVDHLLAKYAGIIPQELRNDVGAPLDERAQNISRTLRGPMAIACALRAANNNFDFDTIDVGVLLSIEDDNIKKKQSRCSTIKQRLPDLPNLKLANVREFYRLFSRETYKKWLRGKLCLQIWKLLFQQRCQEVIPDKEWRPLLNFFGTDGLSEARAALREIEPLRGYCVAQALASDTP